MGSPRSRAIVLDTGALIALEKRSARMEALLRMAQAQGVRVIIPAGVLAKSWTADPRQAPIHRLLKRATTKVPALDRVLAEAAGRLCTARSTDDVIDASVVIAGRAEHAVVITSDPDDLRRLDPALDVETI